MKKRHKSNRIAEFEKYAEGRHGFITASLVLSGLSAILSVIPFYFIWLVVRDALDGTTDVMVFNGLMALGTAVASVLVYIAALMVSHLAAFRISKNMKKALVGHVLTLPPGALDEDGTGRIRRVIQDSVESTHEFIAHNQPDLAGSKVLPFAIVALLLVFDWRLGIAAMIPVVLGTYVSMSMMGKSAMQESMAMWQNSMADVSNQTVEYIRGISVVKIFQQTVESFQSLKDSVDRWAEYCQNYTELARRPMTEFFTLINGCMTFVVAAAVVIIEFLENGSVSNSLVAAIVFYVIFTPLISTLMMRIMFTSDQTYRVDDALSRINGVLAMQPLPEAAAPEEPEDCTLRFEHVTFSYSPDAPPAVKDFTLEMRHGTVTALVGASGSGKSTVAGLASRFWDPQGGTVSLGGKDLRNISTKTLRGMECFVFQHNHLIKGTLMDNVRLGRPDASVDEVSKALESAQCSDIIAKLPDGLDTLIGPGGVYLSGGEVQRVAIARAILRDSPIIIMDEATAFADPENEHLIQKAFEELARGRTVLLIAHRLTTVMNADVICVMDGGSIVESGRHSDLMDMDGRYRTMWDDYQKALSWKVKGAAV
jgi:ATP-binding cassette subfamily B protein